MDVVQGELLIHLILLHYRWGRNFDHRHALSRVSRRVSLRWVTFSDDQSLQASTPSNSIAFICSGIKKKLDAVTQKPREGPLLRKAKMCFQFISSLSKPENVWCLTNRWIIIGNYYSHSFNFNFSPKPDSFSNANNNFFSSISQHQQLKLLHLDLKDLFSPFFLASDQIENLSLCVEDHYQQQTQTQILSSSSLPKNEGEKKQLIVWPSHLRKLSLEGSIELFLSPSFPLPFTLRHLVLPNFPGLLPSEVVWSGLLVSSLQGLEEGLEILEIPCFWLPAFLRSSLRFTQVTRVVVQIGPTDSFFLTEQDNLSFAPQLRHLHLRLGCWTYQLQRPWPSSLRVLKISLDRKILLGDQSDRVFVRKPQLEILELPSQLEYLSVDSDLETQFYSLAAPTWPSSLKRIQGRFRIEDDLKSFWGQLGFPASWVQKRQQGGVLYLDLYRQDEDAWRVQQLDLLHYWHSVNIAWKGPMQSAWLSSLHCLRLFRQFDQNLDFLPPNLVELDLSHCHSFNRSLPSDLPLSLRILRLGPFFNQALVPLPHLETLWIGFVSSRETRTQKLNSDLWLMNLAIFNQPLISFPSLVSLTLHSRKFQHPLEPVLSSCLRDVSVIVPQWSQNHNLCQQVAACSSLVILTLELHPHHRWPALTQGGALHTLRLFSRRDCSTFPCDSLLLSLDLSELRHLTIPASYQSLINEINTRRDRGELSNLCLETLNLKTSSSEKIKRANPKAKSRRGNKK